MQLGILYHLLLHDYILNMLDVFTFLRRLLPELHLVIVVTVVTVSGIVHYSLVFLTVYNLHFEFLRIRAFILLLVFDHTIYRLNREPALGSELLDLVDCAVVDGDVDVEVAEDGELLALFNKHLRPLAFRVTLLNQVKYWFNVPVPCCHLKIFYAYFIIISLNSINEN